MTTSHDDIIKLAMSNGAVLSKVGYVFDQQELEAFFHAAQKMEREGCASTLEALWHSNDDSTRKCIEAIRNRSNHETK